MSFLGGLFGGAKQKTPRVVPPPPEIGDATGEAAAREERYRVKRKVGVADTMLSGGVGAGTNSDQRGQGRTMLG